MSVVYYHKVNFVTVLFLLLIFSNHLLAQGTAAEDNITTEMHHVNFLEFGLEYYYPFHWNRQINTVNLNGFIGKEFVRDIGLQIFAGATITHAWGNIIAVNEFHKEEKYETSAIGIGPIILLRLQPLTIDNFSFSVDALGGIILYNKSFPPGGDIYNFIFRLGGTITFEVGNNYSLNFGLRRMHISNGQGVGSFNPFYEGNGLSLNLTKHF